MQVYRLPLKLCCVTKVVCFLLQKPLQESSPLRGLRRYDSCGSLDSRTVNQITKDNKSNSSGYNSQEYDSTHKGEKVANTTEEGDSGKFLNYFMNHINELTAETDELCNPSVHLHAPRYTSNETQV